MAIVASGDWWSLDDNGAGKFMLFVFCEGDMPVYETPWINYAEDIIAIDIADSVTSIPNSAFDYSGTEHRYIYLESVTIGSGVTSIGSYAFYGCEELKSIVISDSVSEIGTGAFSNCYMLENVYYTGSSAQWNTITVQINNNELFRASLHYDWTLAHTVSHTVTFDSNGGTVIAPQSVLDGFLASRPSDPTIDGYSFECWCLNGIPYNFSTRVTSDITLIARWIGASVSFLPTINVNVRYTDSDGNNHFTYFTLDTYRLNSISVDTSGMETTTYGVGESIDYSGIEATGHYSNGTEKDFTDLIELDPPNGYLVQSAGKIIVTYRYNDGEWGQFELTAIADKIKYIRIVSYPKTAYKIYETVDYTGFRATVTYTDNRTVDISKQCSFEPPQDYLLRSAGNLVAEVYYNNGLLAQWDLTVTEREVVDSGNGWTLYEGDDDDDDDDLLLYIDNDEGISSEDWEPYRPRIETIVIGDGVGDIDDGALSGFPNVRKVVIEGNGDTRIGDDTFSNNPNLREVIIGDGVTTIGDDAFSNNPNLRRVKIGRNVKTIGDDAFSNCPNLTDVDYDGTILEWALINIGEGSPILTATIHFTGLLSVEVVSPPKTEYEVGDKTDYSDFQAIAHYKNDPDEDITLVCDFVPVEGTIILQAGTTSLEVSYFRNFLARYDLIAVAGEIQSIEIVSPPTKREYEVGEPTDYTGFQAVIHYADGTDEDITGDCVFEPASGSIVLSEGTFTVDVLYNGGRLARYDMTAVAGEIKSIEIDAYPDDLSYEIGEGTDYSGFSVTVTLPDGTTEDITDDCTFSPPSGAQLTPGTHTVDVYYNGGKLTSFDLSVGGAITASGSWWTLYHDGTLHVYGNIPDYSYYYGEYPPWEWYRTRITRLFVDDIVSTIGEDVFRNDDNRYPNLKKVRIGSGITFIDEDAFAYIELDELEIMFNFDSNPFVGELNNHTNPFRGSSANRLIFGDEITDLNYFFNESGIYSKMSFLKIGNGVETIGANRFRSDKYLREVIIGDGVTAIGKEAFAGCENLTSIVFGESIATISDEAFRECGFSWDTFESKPLNDIVIPDSVITIGDSAFFGCEIYSVIIGDGVTDIGESAFVCQRNDGQDTTACLAFLELGNNVRNIGDYAFPDFNGTTLEIPDSVVTIGKSAFEHSSNLQTLSIGIGLQSIGQQAFNGCGSLTDIYYAGTRAQWNAISKGYHAIPSGVTIHYESVLPS